MSTVQVSPGKGVATGATVVVVVVITVVSPDEVVLSVTEDVGGGPSAIQPVWVVVTGVVSGVTMVGFAT